MKNIFLSIIIVLTFSVIFNCHIAYAVRPLSTEDASVTDTGRLELEMGFEYTRIDNRDNNYNLLLVPCYGLIRNIQVACEIPFNIVRPEEESDEEGLGDITLVLKTLIFLETEKTPSFLLKTAVKLATGDEDRGLGSGDEDVSLIFAATKSIGRGTTVHGNIGYTFVGEDWDSSLNDCLVCGIALEYSLIPKLTIVSEVYGESDIDFNSDSHTISPLIGLNYQLTDRITFDTAFKTGICYEEKLEYGIIGGISISL